MKSFSETVGVFSLYAVVHQLISADRAAPINSILGYLDADPAAQTLSIFYVTIFVVSTFSVISANYFMNIYYGFLVHQTSTNTLCQKFVNSFATDYSVSDVKDVIVESENLVLGLFVPSVRIISDSLTIFLITIMLLIVHPLVTVNAVFFVFIIYFALQLIFSNPTVRLGARREKLEEGRMVAAHNVIYGRSDVRNYAQFEKIISNFKLISSEYNFVTALRKTIPIVMKKSLESVFFLVITGFVFYEVESNELNNALYLFGAAFLRLMPAIANIMAERNQLAFYSSLIDRIPKKLNPIFYVENVKKIQLKGKRLVRGNKLIASNVNVSINSGDRVLVCGPSGSGKSTLVRLIFGLEYEKGFELQINSSTVKEGTILSTVSFLSNQSLLLPNSVFENIAFNTSIDKTVEQDIISLCDELGIHDEILSFEFGYNTNIGEQGSKVSFGQRQRILIARAIFSGLTTLVFDEMSNALDSENKVQILTYLFSLPDEYTVVFITHDNIPRKFFNRQIAVSNEAGSVFATNVIMDQNNTPISFKK